MVQILGENYTGLSKSLHRYLSFTSRDCLQNTNLIFVFNINWAETRSVICRFRKDEIEQSAGDLVHLKPIIIFSLTPVRFNTGIKNLYYFVDLDNLSSIKEFSYAPILLKRKQAEILWQELCKDYIRKLIHDLCVFR